MLSTVLGNPTGDDDQNHAHNHWYQHEEVFMTHMCLRRFIGCDQVLFSMRSSMAQLSPDQVW
jgi:hypothetical protein